MKDTIDPKIEVAAVKHQWQAPSITHLQSKQTDGKLAYYAYESFPTSGPS